MAEDTPRLPVDCEHQFSNSYQVSQLVNLALTRIVEDTPRPPRRLAKSTNKAETRACNFVSTRIVEDTPRPPRDRLPKQLSEALFLLFNSEPMNLDVNWDGGDTPRPPRD